MATAAELRQILKEDANGQNLYDHLTQTLMKILVDRPKNAFESFELISAEVKANPLAPEQTLARPLEVIPEQLNAQKTWMDRNAAMLKVPDEPPEDPSVKLQDLLEDAPLFEWGGVSVGRSELFRLQLSMKKFVEKAQLPSDAERVRFVGRISTRSRPYYVLETLTVDELESRDERLQEGRNGANKFEYFVTQVPEACDWVKLPPVTSEQVVKVRQFRRLLTGNLDAAVPSYPPFPGGSERFLLRAILANIVHDTSVSPDGFYDLDTDADPPLVKAAEAEAFNERFPKSSGDLKDVEGGWKHHETPLNLIGRVTALPEETDESGEPVPQESEPAEVNAPLDALKPEQWAVRVSPGGAATSSTSCVVLRSLKWPGAVAVAQGRKYVNVYVGNGLSSAGGQFYSPPLPGVVQIEFVNGLTADGTPQPSLVEQTDVKVDPTPPQPENAENEE
jgi:radial spoke head protein 4A